MFASASICLRRVVCMRVCVLVGWGRRFSGAVGGGITLTSSLLITQQQSALIVEASHACDVFKYLAAWSHVNKVGGCLRGRKWRNKAGHWLCFEAVYSPWPAEQLLLCVHPSPREDLLPSWTFWSWCWVNMLWHRKENWEDFFKLAPEKSGQDTANTCTCNLYLLYESDQEILIQDFVGDVKWKTIRILQDLWDLWVTKIQLLFYT